VAVLADGVCVVRGRRWVLDQVAFAVPAGTVTGLLGPSGCGKTTLLRCVVGLQARVSGHLRVLEQPAGAKILRHRIGYMAQEPCVYADLTVSENLRYFAAILGQPRRERARNSDRVLHAVDLRAHAGTVVARLSGGQRARVSLAVALLGSPELLVLDEPTVGLDPVLRLRLWDLFGRLADDGVTVLVSSHVMDEADRCDRLLLLRAGRLLAAGTRTDLLARTGTTRAEDAFLCLVGHDRTPGSAHLEEIGWG
jgi:ABC-2 type transport system ATP-binding protein